MNLSFLTCLATLAFGTTPVVVSTDCGCEIDDQWAITHLALAREIDLRAIISTHSPGLGAEASAAVVRELLGLLPASERAPVVAGSDGAILNRRTPNRNPGVDRLLADSRGFDAHKRLTVVMIGAATDVASALILDPTLSDRIKIVAMAFDGWPAGGDPFNVRNDVAAWQVVMASTVPLTVVDADVTRRHLTLTSRNASVRFGKLSPLSVHLVALLRNWIDREHDLALRITRQADAWPIWDSGTVAVLLGNATIVEHPRPSLRNDRILDHALPSGKIRWVTAIDETALWVDLARLLGEAR